MILGTLDNDSWIQSGVSPANNGGCASYGVPCNGARVGCSFSDGMLEKLGCFAVALAFEEFGCQEVLQAAASGAAADSNHDAHTFLVTAQWDRILAIGPLFPVTLGDLDAVRGVGVGEFFHRIASDVHRRPSDFVHAVVHRRDEAIRRWRNWLRKYPLVHPYKWLRPDLVPLAPFLQCKPHLSPGGSWVLFDPSRIYEKFRKAWLPYFALGKGRGGLPLLPEVDVLG